MTAVEDRPLRADAARNVERILRAARDVYGELGADAPVEAVARRAGVGERTLYRRFPTKADLVRAALDQSIAEDLMPAIDDARRTDDPLRGLTQLIEAASRHGVEKMIYLGSASSYPANAPVPLREQDLFKGLPEPGRAEHGVAKRLPLIQALAYRQQYGFHCSCLIPTNFYGPGDNFDPRTSFVIPSLIRKFLEAAETGAPDIAIGGTGCATRDFIHVEDCAEAVLLALEHYQGADPINVGSGSEIPIHELARRIAVLTGYTGKIHWDPSYPEGTMRRVLDVTRAQKEFGFRARRSLSDGLFETIEWYRSTKSCPLPHPEPSVIEQSV